MPMVTDLTCFMTDERSEFNILARGTEGQSWDWASSGLAHVWAEKCYLSGLAEGAYLARKYLPRVALVAQRIKIHMPVQGTWVPSFLWKDPTYCEAAGPLHHNYWTRAPEPLSCNYWAHAPQLLKSSRLELMLHDKRSHHNEKPAHHTTRDSPCAATKNQCKQTKFDLYTYIKKISSRTFVSRFLKFQQYRITPSLHNRAERLLR